MDSAWKPWRFFTTAPSKSRRWLDVTSLRLTYHRVRCHLLGSGRSRGRSMRQEVAQRQGRRDNLPFFLKVKIIQTVTALRRRHDRHRLRRRVMMMMMMVLLLMVQTAVHGQVAALVVAAVIVGARTGRHQIDTAHAYGHRARRGKVLILATAASLPAPRAENRYECRQRSYRVADAASIPVYTCSRGRRRQWLASSFDTSRSRLHGLRIRLARLPRARRRSPRGPSALVALELLSRVIDRLGGRASDRRARGKKARLFQRDVFQSCHLWNSCAAS